MDQKLLSQTNSGQTKATINNAEKKNPVSYDRALVSSLRRLVSRLQFSKVELEVTKLQKKKVKRPRRRGTGKRREAGKRQGHLK